MSQYQIALHQASESQTYDVAQAFHHTASGAEEALDAALARGFHDLEITRDGDPISEEQLRRDAEAERTFDVG